MATRTVEELIEEVRDNTNNQNKTRFTDKMLIRFFDSASRTIQMLIYNAYPQDAVFYDCDEIEVTAGKSTYRLPSGMLSPHAIYSIVPLRADGSKSDPLHRLSLQEVATEYGYILRGKNFQINPLSIINLSSLTSIRVNYAKKWDRLTSIDQVPECPEILEDFLTAFVERKIHYVDSSKDVMNSNIFTQEEKDDMVKLYMDQARDPKYPPTGSDTYLSY